MTHEEDLQEVQKLWNKWFMLFGLYGGGVSVEAREFIERYLERLKREREYLN